MEDFSTGLKHEIRLEAIKANFSTFAEAAQP